MINEFNPCPAEDPAESTAIAPVPFNGCFPLIEAEYRKPKRKKRKKGKKGKRLQEVQEALEKTKWERDQILYVNGWLGMENSILKRTIMLAVAAKRGRFNDNLSADILSVLPPPTKW